MERGKGKKMNKRKKDGKKVGRKGKVKSKKIKIKERDEGKRIKLIGK